MEKITLADKTFKPYIPYGQISDAIDKVAERLNADYSGCGEIPVLVCVLNGAILFCAELMKRLTFDCELVSMKLSSYEGTSSTGVVREVMGLSGSVKGRKAIIVEDIVDTGTTIVSMVDTPKAKGVPLDYGGMEIPNRFIVGFGLDYNELGRNYKDIYVIDQ